MSRIYFRKAEKKYGDAEKSFFGGGRKKIRGSRNKFREGRKKIVENKFSVFLEIPEFDSSLGQNRQKGGGAERE